MIQNVSGWERSTSGSYECDIHRERKLFGCAVNNGLMYTFKSVLKVKMFKGGAAYEFKPNNLTK